jgi:hypothetical protein
VIVVIAVALARLALVGHFELSPDEAYYLTWADPAAAGPDHPAGMVVLAKMALGLHSLGLPIETATRAPAVLLSLCTALMLLHVARRLGAGRNGSMTFAVLASALPLPASGGLLLTPDVPLMAAWALGMLSFRPSSPAGSNVSSRRGALPLLAACLLAPLFKVSGYLLLPSILLSRKAAGDPLPRREIALNVAVSALTLPFTAPSLVFQAVHAFTAAGPAEGLAQPAPFFLGGTLLFALGQVALLLPALPLAGVAFAGARPLLLGGASTLVPCLVSSLVRVPEPSWAAPAYPFLLVAFALAAERASSLRRSVALGLSTATAAILHVHLVHPVLPLGNSDPTARLHGWKRHVCEGGPLPAEGLPPYAVRSERLVYGPSCPGAGAPPP